MTKIAKRYAELVAEDMDAIVVREREDDEFLNRRDHAKSCDRIKAAAKMATRRADAWASLADAYYARDFKGIEKTEEIAELESELEEIGAEELISEAVEAAAFWSE